MLGREIFELETYTSHGIALEDGACVLDVGANAGFFSMFLARRLAGVRVWAFEPVPANFALLERNARLAPHGAELRLFPAAVGREPGQARVFDDPGLSLVASAHPAAVRDAARRDAPLHEWARAAVADSARCDLLPAGLARGLDRLLRRPGLRWIALAPLLLLAAALDLRRRLRTRTCDCRQVSLSQVLAAEQIERVDLLKVDVEGGEWDVLAGIAAEHWPLVRQAVVEVHDADGRLARVVGLFREHGFEVEIAREDWDLHALLGIHTVYARRAAGDVRDARRADARTSNR